MYPITAAVSRLIQIAIRVLTGTKAAWKLAMQIRQAKNTLAPEKKPWKASYKLHLMLQAPGPSPHRARMAARKVGETMLLE